jgi:S-methylmethionine-dependent homocysteine/selenocysteine methylase
VAVNEANRYEAMMDDLARGGLVLMDGGTGSEVERRGIEPVQEAWSSTGVVDGPGIVRQVHGDYLAAGARILITDTFSTSRNTLADAGLEDRFELLNRRAVELARRAVEEAGDGRAVVAGGISTWSFTGRWPVLDHLHQAVAEQAKIMAEAGADLLILEMMADVERTLTVLDASRQSGLPVWVGVSATTGEGGGYRGPTPDGTVRMLGGEPLADLVAALRGREVPMLAVMHTQVEDVDPSLDVLEEGGWEGTICVYAHSGYFEKPRWIFDDVISPDGYAAHAERWIERGVRVIGGCCGIGPAHIERLRPLVGG